MKRKILLFINLLFISFLLFSQTEKSEIFVENSLYPENHYVLLNCKWDFFESKFLSPVVFYENDRTVDINLDWFDGKQVSLPYEIESKKGFATYHCRVQNLKPETMYAITLYKSIYTCADLYVNGKQVYNCNTLSAENKGKKANRNYTLVSFMSDKNGILDFVFHVSNHELSRGGILLVPKFAEEHFMKQYMLKQIAFEILIAGVLLLLAFYNLLIFILNSNQKMLLFLILLCLDLIVVVCSLDFSLIGYFLVEIKIALAFKITLTSLALIIPLYNLYAVNLYGIKFKWNIVAIIIDFLIPLLIAVLPMPIVSNIVGYFMLALYIMSIYLCCIIQKNKKEPDYIYSLNIFIIIAMLLSAAYGLVFAQSHPEGNKGVTLFKLSIMLFAFTQTMLAGIKRDFESDRIRKMLNVYESLNLSYTRFIPKQVINCLQVEKSKEIEPGDNSTCEAMILIVDICNFDSLESIFSKEGKFYMLSKYYENIANVVSENGGFISAYLNFGVVIIFPEHTDAVCRCALEIQKRTKSVLLNYNNKISVLPKIQIGIHCGKVAVGFMGNSKNMSSVACSDVLVQALLICSKNKDIESDMLISEDALVYCRSFTGCLFEGVLADINGNNSLVYKMIPFDNYKFSTEERV